MLILSSNRSKSSDSNLAALASFLGANVRFSNSPTVEMFLACSENAAPPAAVALSADTLAALHREENLRESVREKLLSFRTIFLYGIAARTHDDTAAMAKRRLNDRNGDLDQRGPARTSSRWQALFAAIIRSKLSTTEKCDHLRRFFAWNQQHRAHHRSFRQAYVLVLAG